MYSELMSVGHECLEALIQELLHSDTIKIVFIHTYGRNGSYNPHLHILLAEGGLNPDTNQWVPINRLPLSKLRLKWQAHLLEFMLTRVGELNGIIKGLRDKHPKGFYVHPGNDKKVPTKNYRGLLKYLTKYLASPPIGVSKITSVSGGHVSYYYQSYSSKRREYESPNEVFMEHLLAA
ncbi:transposase [Shewanella surugensis]|uniref:Transposase n=1 Tax=Shewanella surugensis TaxID=212020 RepID=A0ABT0LAX8_9GAMM|nr:transposase [Shewanella surugensis]MCL1124326.1 transposase [Shewanella surugensis]